MILFSFAVLSASFLLTSGLNLDALLEPDHALDATAVPCSLTPEQLVQIQTPPAGNAQKFILIADTLPEDFANRSAQMLATSGFQVCRYAPELGVIGGEVVMYDEAGRPVVFYGRRQAESLFEFVQKHDALLTSVHNFQTITNKMEKKALESIMEPKLVAYIPDLTMPAWALFQQVAGQVSAQMPVFVTHDAHMAAKFRITAANQMVIINRLEKSYVNFNLDPTMGVATTPAEVIAWVSQNRGVVIHELSDLNLYDPELRDPTKYIFVAIGDKSAPFGIYFHRALTKTIRNITKENQIIQNVAAAPVQAVPALPVSLQDIEIVWIDAAKFPSAVKKFATQFQVPVHLTASKIGRSIQFGLMQLPVGVSLPVGASQWFDVSTIFPAPGAIQQKFDDHAGVAALKTWILSMSARLPVFTSQVPVQGLPVQDFALEPTAVTALEGSSFVLNCKTINKLGRCQWQKDGMVLPVSSTGHIRLVNREDPQDCSIAVSGARPVQDTGSWSCHVTSVQLGASMVPAISSHPVSVVVVPTEPTEQTGSGKKDKKAKKAKKAPKTEL